MGGFEQFAASRGLDPWPRGLNATMDELSDWYQARARQLQGANYTSQRSIECGLITSQHLNAVASIEGETDVIAIYSGTITILMNLFKVMLSRSDILACIGDASAENGGTVLGPEVDLATLSLSAWPTPKDKNRVSYASRLAWIARYFIFEHEFCHLFNGHVDWQRARVGLNALAEVSDGEPISFLDRQTLEMDADCYGASRTLLTVFRATPAVAFGNAAHLLTYKDAVFAISFSLYCLFRLFRLHPVTRDTRLIGGSNHPPAILRYHICAITLHSRIFDNVSVSTFISMEDFRAASNDALAEGMRAFELLGLGQTGTPMWEGLIEMLQSAANELRGNWTRIRGELLVHKRGARLAE